MAGLRELKERINSVRSARKITTAMQMVASSKLKKAARASENFVPYQHMLRSILDDFLVYEPRYDSPYVEKRKVKKVVLVAFASNSGFCGSFNSNIISRLAREVEDWKSKGVEEITAITIGKRVTSAARRLPHITHVEEWDRLIDPPNYDGARELADTLLERYKKKQIDKVDLIFFHYVNPMVRELTLWNYLPVDLDQLPRKKKSYLNYYILEPAGATLLRELLPKVLRSRIYASLLDSFSSEQGARTIAMQMASDNASNLLDQLNIEANRLRQQLVTNEILELSAASEADNF